jgi:hypothetical protein
MSFLPLPAIASAHAISKEWESAATMPAVKAQTQQQTNLFATLEMQQGFGSIATLAIFFKCGACAWRAAVETPAMRDSTLNDFMNQVRTASV